jgi:integrase
VPVPEADVDATLPHLSRHVRAMVELQLLTGMRPGELCALRTCDVDRGGKLWTYSPAAHKTQHHGHARVIYLGPKAQAVLAPFLKPELSAAVFSPADAEVERLAAKRARRRTPLSCGNVPGSNRVAVRRRAPRDRYDVASYRRAITRGCERAFGMPADLPHAERLAWRGAHCWHPHQLRHTAATRLRKDYGLEAAQVILGHKTLTVTQVYAERNVAAAQIVMAAVG